MGECGGCFLGEREAGAAESYVDPCGLPACRPHKTAELLIVVEDLKKWVHGGFANDEARSDDAA